MSDSIYRFNCDDHYHASDVRNCPECVRLGLEEPVTTIEERIHALNELNLDQSFVTTKRELLEKLK